MGTVLAFELGLEKLTCGECGISFAVPVHWLNARRDENENDGKFYCPNGHSRQFCDTEVAKLTRKLQQAEESVEWHKWRAEANDRARAAALGHVTRLKKRIANGVCPACQRSFQNLKRHMASKHPQLALPPA